MDSQLVISLKRQKSSSVLEIASPAKLNLYLNCIGKYPASAGPHYAHFHKIESIFERISLCDTLRIEASCGSGVSVTSNVEHLASQDNLIVKALKLLAGTLRLKTRFTVHLTKRIPMGSGLGGGSSNAASALIGANILLKLDLGREELYRLGARIGSDVNFFLSGARFAYVCGKGEQVTPLESPLTLVHTVIWPGIHVSTAEVYKHTRVDLTKFFDGAKILQHALRKGDGTLINKSVFNALEKKAFKVCPQLERIRDELRERGFAVAMTGSGSAFYTIDSFKPACPYLRQVTRCQSISMRALRSIGRARVFAAKAHTF